MTLAVTLTIIFNVKYEIHYTSAKNGPIAPK